MRIRAFPFHDDVRASSPPTKKVFVVEQNRDAPAAHLLINELEINPAKLKRVLHFDGSPITARFIAARSPKIAAPD
jgi:2-oxoglutarate ferredoxin oxidoreductase subunit alpha